MTKSELLTSIVEAGYNVGFGAKKHFATYDIVDKTPGFISFVSMAFGIYALAFDTLSTKFLSASFIVLGVIGLYITLYDHKKNQYEELGVKLTQIYNALAALYRNVKNADEGSIDNLEQELKLLQDEYHASCQSKQIMFSDWYAHYKFFWQHQIDWLEEQKKFSLFRDKIPLTFSLSFIGVLVTLSVLGFESAKELCALILQ